MRLENGAGTVYELLGNRRKKYAARVTVGWDSNGKQIRKYIGYYKTPSEAMLALAQYNSGGYDIDLSKLTLNEVFELWIKQVEKKNLSPAIYRTHRMAHSRFGRLGKLKMRDIKALQLQTWLENTDVKPGTKKKLRSTLNQIYKYAITNDIVQKNYAETLEINEKVEKTGAVFTNEEIELLWKNVDNPTVQYLLILIYTGMRIGELLKVKREHINFEEAYLIGGSKTEAGRDRIIPLHRKILPLVEQRLGDNTYLWQSDRGQQPVAYSTAKYQATRLFEQFGMHHRLHDTRKTAVSLMHSGGIAIEVIRIIVGHAGNSVTEQVYLYKQAPELVKQINRIEIQ